MRKLLPEFERKMGNERRYAPLPVRARHGLLAQGSS